MVKIADGREFPAKQIFAMLEGSYTSTEFLVSDFPDRCANIQAVKKEIKMVTDRPGGLWLVAIGQGRLCGFLEVAPVGNTKRQHTAWRRIAGLPESRGRGVGKMLVAAAMEKIKEQ